MTGNWGFGQRVSVSLGSLISGWIYAGTRRQSGRRLLLRLFPSSGWRREGADRYSANFVMIRLFIREAGKAIKATGSVGLGCS